MYIIVTPTLYSLQEEESWGVTEANSMRLQTLTGWPDRTEELLRLLHSWQVEVDAEGMDPNPGFDPNYLRENYLRD